MTLLLLKNMWFFCIEESQIGPIIHFNTNAPFYVYFNAVLRVRVEFAYFVLIYSWFQVACHMERKLWNQTDQSNARYTATSLDMASLIGFNFDSHGTRNPKLTVWRSSQNSTTLLLYSCPTAICRNHNQWCHQFGVLWSQLVVVLIGPQFVHQTIQDWKVIGWIHNQYSRLMIYTPKCTAHCNMLCQVIDWNPAS